MPTEKKKEIVSQLQETMAKSNIIVLSDYRGLTAPQMTTLRRRLRAANAEVKVVKNTLARLAAKNAGKPALVDSLQGTTAVTFGYGDLAAPVKALMAYQSEAEGLSIKGGLLGDKPYAREEIMALATLPSREVLLGRVLGQMTAPISMLIGSLASPMRGLGYVLQARIKQLEAK